MLFNQSTPIEEDVLSFQERYNSAIAGQPTEMLPYGYDPLEEMACQIVDDSYIRNEQFHHDTHEKFRRLYNFVRLNRPKTNVKVQDLLEFERSDLRFGLAWMITDVIHSTLCNSILSGKPKLTNFAKKPLMISQPIEQTIHHQCRDEVTNINAKCAEAFMDETITGNSVRFHGWRRKVKRVFQENPLTGTMEEQWVQTFVGPEVTEFAPWNCFPTAGISDFKEAHEIILKIEGMPLHEMRQYEAEGYFEKGSVDRFVAIAGTQKQVDAFNDTPVSQREKRLPTNESAYDVLIYLGYFPLYSYDAYYDPIDGRDLSAEEVPCIIIKPANVNVCFKLERIDNANQEFGVEVGKYQAISGEPWGIGPIEMCEDLMVHYGNWVNILQDLANLIAYPDEIEPQSGIDDSDKEQIGVGRRFKVANGNFATQALPHRVWAQIPPSILNLAYKQLDVVMAIIQDISAVTDFIKGRSDRPKTAEEVRELSQNLMDRFKARIDYIEQNTYRPTLNWVLSLDAQYWRDIDPLVKSLTNLPVNPFKFISPIMPNPLVRWQLDGAIRASDSLINAQKLEHLLALAGEIPPGQDEDGVYKQINRLRLWKDYGTQSQIEDMDKYLEPATVPMLDPNMMSQIIGSRTAGAGGGSMTGNIKRQIKQPIGSNNRGRQR